MKTTFLFTLLTLCACFSNLSAQSIGYKLAVIEKNGYVSENDLLVKRFNNIVNQLDIKYIENKEQIGDMTVSGRNQLIEMGIKEQMINVMEGICRLTDLYTKKKQYSDNVSCYLILRSKGFSHDEALKKLQDLLNSMSMEEIKKSIGL
jgi:hypothetical protein